MEQPGRRRGIRLVDVPPYHPAAIAGARKRDIEQPHILGEFFTYRERPVFTRGWKSREGLLPSDYWRRNMFVEFMEDDLGIRIRDEIGVDTMLWGSDFPHAESTWPKSREFLERIFAGTPEEDRRKITSDNAAALFKFKLP